MLRRGDQDRAQGHVRMSIETAIDFLSSALAAMRLESGRGSRLDLFADRLVKASSEPALPAAMEHLLRAIDASTDDIHPPLAARMLAVANGPDGPRLLRWWREQAKLVTLIAATRDEEVRKAALAEIELPATLAEGRAVLRGDYKISLRASCETPLAHGADGKAGNATIFRRMDVLTDAGTLHLPYYAGNALRGQMRDLLADHFLLSLGMRADRVNPVISMWFFYALYSGGALEENSEATKALKKQLGDHGAIRATGIRDFRTILPGLSLLGCALGNRVLPGHVQIADLRPVCYEWGTGDRPVAELLTWEYLTRREDHEDHTVNHAMIANSEVLRAGTELEGGIDYDHATPELERAALGRGLALLAEVGQLGAENRRGFGRVKLVIDGAPDPAPYDAFLQDNAGEIKQYLERIGAFPDLAA